MITIYLDTTQGIMVSEDTEDDLDDEFTKYLIAEITEAARKVYCDFIGIGQVVH
jgi:hypothetical protein